MSYHLIVHLKAKGTATCGRTKWRFCTPGLVRVDHSVVVSRRGQQIGHIVALAVSSRSSRRSHGLRQVGMLTLSLVSGDARCSTSISRHRHESARCVGDSQGRTLNDPVAVHS